MDLHDWMDALSCLFPISKFMVAWLSVGVRMRSQLSSAFPNGNPSFLKLKWTVDWTSLLKLTTGKFYPELAFLLSGTFTNFFVQIGDSQCSKQISSFRNWWLLKSERGPSWPLESERTFDLWIKSLLICKVLLRCVCGWVGVGGVLCWTCLCQCYLVTYLTLIVFSHFLDYSWMNLSFHNELLHLPNM